MRCLACSSCFSNCASLAFAACSAAFMAPKATSAACARPSGRLNPGVCRGLFPTCSAGFGRLIFAFSSSHSCSASLTQARAYSNLSWSDVPPSGLFPPPVSTCIFFLLFFFFSKRKDSPEGTPPETAFFPRKKGNGVSAAPFFCCLSVYSIAQNPCNIPEHLFRGTAFSPIWRTSPPPRHPFTEPSITPFIKKRWRNG